MRDPVESNNEAIYQLVRANLRAAIKGAVYFDNSNFITHKLDQFYTQFHAMGHYKFLEALSKKLQDMEEDFNHDMPEFQKLTETIHGLKKYIHVKITTDL